MEAGDVGVEALRDGHVVYVSFSAEINPTTTESLIATLASLVNKCVTDVHLLLSTPGGSVANGLSLYHTMRAMPFHLTTHNVGNVDSVGNIVFLAGERRYACPSSTFMFHGITWHIDGSHRLDEATLRQRQDSILADQQRMGQLIVDRTRLSWPRVKRLFREGATMNATRAAGFGIVDDVREPEIPMGGPVLALVYGR